MSCCGTSYFVRMRSIRTICDFAICPLKYKLKKKQGGHLVTLLSVYLYWNLTKCTYRSTCHRHRTLFKASPYTLLAVEQKTSSENTIHIWCIHTSTSCFNTRTHTHTHSHTYTPSSVIKTGSFVPGAMSLIWERKSSTTCIVSWFVMHHAVGWPARRCTI